MKSIITLFISLFAMSLFAQETVKSVLELEKEKLELEEKIRQAKIQELKESGSEDVQTQIDLLEKKEQEKVLLANTVKYYRAHILNTNFAIPFARFDFKKKEDDSKTLTGDLTLFNSIGAGCGYSWGELKVTRNNEGEVIEQDFSNTFGINLGILFSAGTGDDTNNVFAPVINASVLDFQIGFGYELGTVSDNHKRTFLTLSYAIPLYKLKRTGLWIIKKTELSDLESDNKSRHSFK
jgi:hypothetical protein